MEISYQISWSRSAFGRYCNTTDVANSYVNTGEGTFQCQYGCSGNIVPRIPYVCTYFSPEDNWIFGEYHLDYNFIDIIILDDNTVTIGTVNGDWIREVGEGRWNISTTFSLTKRNDTGRVNSSPRVLPTLPLRLQSGCNYTIPLPVSDPDNDTVQCRWAVGRECSSICNQLTGATLDTNTCTITYTANYGTGIKAVAIMIEDYAPGSPHHPLSSVALQFLIMVYYSSQSCSSYTEWSRFPSITLHPSNKVVFLGKQYINLTLTCKANETSFYYWERQNGSIPSTSTGVYTDRLIIFNVQPEDAGSYRCATYVCSSCDRSFSNYAVITINGKPILM